jgi:hypothetical protein
MEFSKKNIRSAPSQKQAENAIEEEKGEGLRSHANHASSDRSHPCDTKRDAFVQQLLPIPSQKNLEAHISPGPDEKGVEPIRIKPCPYQAHTQQLNRRK